MLRPALNPLAEKGWRARVAIKSSCLAALFVLDRITKIWAMRDLRLIGFIPILPFFSLTYVENTGMAFGLGHHKNFFFLVVTSILLPILLFLQWNWRNKNLWVQAGLLLVTAGALGNLYDRVAYGYVVDFLYIHYWPVFNVADSCITIGALCLAWGFQREEKSGNFLGAQPYN